VVGGGAGGLGPAPPRQGGGKRGTTGEVPACMLCLGLYLSDLERRERLS
jgi:hypothetical protein